jgi:hypothetical protein
MAARTNIANSGHVSSVLTSAGPISRARARFVRSRWACARHPCSASTLRHMQVVAQAQAAGCSRRESSDEHLRAAPDAAGAQPPRQSQLHDGIDDVRAEEHGEAAVGAPADRGPAGGRRRRLAVPPARPRPRARSSPFVYLVVISCPSSGDPWWAGPNVGAAPRSRRKGILAVDNAVLQGG